MCHLQQIFVLSTPFRVTKSVLVLIVNRFDNQIIPCAGGTKQNLTDLLRFETPSTQNNYWRKAWNFHHKR